MTDSTRFDENGFVHYAPEPVHAEGVTARVFIGELLGSVSPAVTKTTPLLGAELLIAPGATVALPIRRDFEHAVLAESAEVSVNGAPVEHRALAYVPPGADTISIAAGGEGARVILLGGVPFGEQIVMWWNFIGRDHDEIVEFRHRYQVELGFEIEDPRARDPQLLFGEYPAGQPDPIPAPVLPLTRLTPRQ